VLNVNFLTMDKPTKKSVSKIRSGDEIVLTMSHIFQDAQLSLSGHRKLVIILQAVFEKSTQLDETSNFCLTFTRLVNKVLVLKKGEKVADRIIKFCTSFVAVLVRQHDEDHADNEENDGDDLDDNESPTNEFIKHLINHLLRGVDAKDKTVRYRVVQMLASLVHYIGEIDNDTFEALYTSLTKRIHDREPSVRIQAVVALSRFQAFDFDFDADDFNIAIDKNQIIERIATSLESDESAEVRRAALLNLTKNKYTVPLLLERARDMNNINRRLVYSRISRELGDFKKLTRAQSENLLKWGLNDRDETVREAAIKMFTTFWYNSVDEDLLELIEGLRLANLKVADLAMNIFFSAKPDALSKIKIDIEFWKSLTADKSFLMRAFYYYCNDNKLYDLIDSNFPEAIELAGILQKYFELRNKFLSKNDLVAKKKKRYEDKIESINDQLFVVENLLIKTSHDVEHRSRVLSNEEEKVEYFTGLNEIILKKVDGESIDDDDIDEEVLKELNAMSDDQLYDKMQENEKLIKKTKAGLKSHVAALSESESEFQSATAQYEKLAKDKVNLVGSQAQDHDDVVSFTDELKDLEFIIEQVLLVAKEFDFSDEISRRKMLQIIRSSLTDDKLSPALIEVSLKLLKKLSINEKDFVSMATEIITDIRDSYEDDETFHSAFSALDDNENQDEQYSVPEGGNDDDSTLGSEKLSSPQHKKQKIEAKLPPDDIVIHCLTITQHVLELMEEPLENNLSLGSIYSGLVNYALSCIEKFSLHLLGLKCLGLFALIDKETAKAALGTFYKEMKSCGEQVRIISTKAIVDILSTYGVSIIGSQGLFHYARLLYKSLNTFEMPKLQCIVAEGLCKLFLADIFNGPSDNFDDKEAEFESEKQLFESLILCYFNPLTKKNPELSQVLAFCLPVYAFSHVNHQFRIASVSGDCVYRMFSHDNALVKGNTKLTPNTVVQQLLHWCDPNNLINFNQVQIKRQTSHVWQSVHFLQAVEQGTPKAVKKAIINNLNKLSITEEIESKVLNGLVDAIQGTREFLELKGNEPEFTFDKLTMKNFDNFVVHIEEKLEQALEREKKEAHPSSVSSSRIPSRSNSILGDMDIRDADMEDVDEISNSTRIKEEPENDIETQDKTAEDKQREINDTLEKIDQILAEEDKVEYDISMED